MLSWPCGRRVDGSGVWGCGVKDSVSRRACRGPSWGAQDGDEEWASETRWWRDGQGSPAPPIARRRMRLGSSTSVRA
eukprot:3049519-Prymnesium_polylepis.1